MGGGRGGISTIILCESQGMLRYTIHLLEAILIFKIYFFNLGPPPLPLKYSPESYSLHGQSMAILDTTGLK